MVTGPADQTAAAPDGYSHGRMRTSRADREQAIDALKVAYVQGRLTKDEFDERLGRALAPLTHAELAALTGDLPDGLATAGRPRGADQDMTRLQEGNRAEARVLATLVAGVMLVALIGNGIGSPLHVLAIVLLLSPVWMLALGGVLLLHSRPSRPEDRSARQLPPGPPGAD